MEIRTEVKAIARKELRGYFDSPIAYIVITIFLVFTGFFFFKDFFYVNQAEMRSLFQLLPLMFTFVVPAVTMRLFSEERASGTIEILLTMPVKTPHIVLGKFLGGTLFMAIMIAPTLVYLFTILVVGSPDMGPVIGGYLGSILLAGAYVAVGLLTSSLSRNQIVAFITGWALCFILWLLDKITLFLPGPLSFLEYFGSDFHFQNIAKGLIDTRDVIYFLSVTALGLLLTGRVLEEKR